MYIRAIMLLYVLISKLSAVCFFLFLLQLSVLLAEPVPVSAVLLGEQPAGWVLWGAPQLHLPVRTQPLSAAAALLCWGRARLHGVRARQPDPLRELQSRLRSDTGDLQTHGGGLHWELPGIWDRPPGFGAWLPAAASRPETGGTVVSSYSRCCFLKK